MGDDLDDLNSEEKQTSQRTVAQHLTHLDTIDKSSYINTKNKTLTSLLLSHARFRKYPTSSWWEFAWTLCRRNGKRGLNPSLEIVKLTQGQPSPTYPLHSFFVEAPAVSIARSKRAIGQAAPTLVGSSSNADNNATRDVTSMLVRGGMSIHVERTSLVPSLCFRLRTFFLVFGNSLGKKGKGSFLDNSFWSEIRSLPLRKATPLISHWFCQVHG